MHKNAGVWAGSFFLAISLIYGVTSFQYGYISKDQGIGPGPGFFPFWLCLFMGVCSTIHIFNSIRVPVSVKSILPDIRGMKAIGRIVFCILMYLLIARVAGFIITFTLMLFIFFYGYFKLHVNLLVSLGVVLFLYAVFIIWLGVPLPVNDFGW